jgi:hypothetical protein
MIRTNPIRRPVVPYFLNNENLIYITAKIIIEAADIVFHIK